MLLCDALIYSYLTIAHFLHALFLHITSFTWVLFPQLLYVTLCSSFFFKYVLITAKSILFEKSTIIDPSVFLVSTMYPPITSSSPMFASPTCPFRSTPSTILSPVLIYFLSIIQVLHTIIFLLHAVADL